jgi:hypothetical protein
LEGSSGEIKARLREIPGVLAVGLLTKKDKKEVIHLEKNAKNRGAAWGTMDFINEGTFEALKREVTWVLLIDENFRDPPRPWMVMLDEDGELLGEWIKKEKIAEMKKRDDVIFMGPDFVMYKKIPKGKPYFLMPSLPFPELDDLPGLENVVSGSPCPPSDEYLKQVLDCEGSKHGTLLVGFDVNKK